MGKNEQAKYKNNSSKNQVPGSSRGPVHFEAYLLLLSYGIPSALGALEFLEVSARTIREIR